MMLGMLIEPLIPRYANQHPLASAPCPALGTGSAPQLGADRWPLASHSTCDQGRKEGEHGSFTTGLDCDPGGPDHRALGQNNITMLAKLFKSLFADGNTNPSFPLLCTLGSEHLEMDLQA